jgi:deoxyribose-phosphate aldolase
MAPNESSPEEDGSPPTRGKMGNPSKNPRPEISRFQLAKRIDSTLLRPTATESDFEVLYNEAIANGFWSVCIPSSRVSAASARLLGGDVKVCTVVGFPFGYSSSSAKLVEASGAIADGAHEVDMVMNVGAFLGGDNVTVAKEISDVSRLCKRGHAILKVIVECCYLTDDGKVSAARLAESNGANFIKTSTGFGPGGASAADVALIRKSLSGKARVKAAGGISNLSDALEMLKAGADRLGTSSAASIMREFDMRC